MRVTAGHSLTWEQPNNSWACLSREPSSPRQHHTLLETNQSHNIGPLSISPFRACVSIFWSKVASAEKSPSGLWENLLSSIIILVVGACVSSWGINYIIDLVGKGHTEENRHSPSPFNFIFSTFLFENQLWLIAILLVVTHFHWQR